MSAARVDVQMSPRDGGSVARLAIDNSAKLNTLDSALMRDIVAAVDALAARDDLRALVEPDIGARDGHDLP